MGGVAGAARGERLWGKRERKGHGAYLGPWLERGGGRAGRPREAGAASGGASGGGDAGPGRGRVVAERLAELESVTEGLFIGEERRWSGRRAVEASKWRVEP